jgi:undecaprenyl-diphosphatase
MAWLDEGIELLVAVVGIFLGLSLLSRRNARWSRGFEARKAAVLLLVAAVVVLVEVTAGVLGQESAAFDRITLLSIHRVLPAGLLPVFSLATHSGSARFLLPVVSLVCLALAWRRHAFEALQLVLSTALAAAVVYFAKTTVDRARPALWETRWYWGSSFPSGHTLSTAAVSTALYLCIARLRPEWRRPAFACACAWVAIVALSRLVLGVHWPTDVVGAACAGLLITVGVNAGLSIVKRRLGRVAAP